MNASMLQLSEGLPSHEMCFASEPPCSQISYTVNTHSYDLPEFGPSSHCGQDETEAHYQFSERHGSGQIPVGALAFRHARHSEYEPAVMTLFESDCIDVGRPDFLLRWGLNDMSVSTHHLRFRCLVYGDQLEALQIPPMVYVRVLSSKPATLYPSGRVVQSRIVSNMDGDVLLSDGDKLRLTPSISAVFHSSAPLSQDDVALDSSMLNDAHRFSDAFQVTNRGLGVGGHAVVVLALSQPHQRQLACKIIPIRVNNKAQVASDAEGCTFNKYRPEAVASKMRSLAREFTVLETLIHPNIIKLESVFVATENVFIFQELITGGDLLSHFDREGALSEPQTVAIVRQILEAVNYLHNHHIVHRDIKPENILLTSWRDGTRIVLTDFGQARSIKKDGAATSVERMKSVVGTYGYTAPEVLQRVVSEDGNDNGYSQAIDIWSIGSIAALALTNEHMFPKQGQAQGARRPHDKPPKKVIVGCNLDKLEDEGLWHAISRNARSFVRKCLQPDEHQRLTAEAALSDPWITHSAYKDEAEAAYQRAIGGWTSRQSTGGLVHYVDTPQLLRSAVKMVHREEALGCFDMPTRDPTAGFAALRNIPTSNWGVSSRRGQTALPTISDDLNMHENRLDRNEDEVSTKDHAQPLGSCIDARAGVIDRECDVKSRHKPLSSTPVTGVTTMLPQPTMHDMHSRYFACRNDAGGSTADADAGPILNRTSIANPAMQSDAVGHDDTPLWEEHQPRKRPCRW